jgi:CO/xanthine dehydrogenase Mo-binding subunit
VAIQDVGRAINPALVTGQVQGGAAQGIGWALHEEMVYDDNGQPLNPTLMDYDLPKASHLPPLQVELVELLSEVGPFGAKGVGEPPVIPTAAAVANALADAVGVRLCELPMTPARVLAALRQHG